MSAPAPPLAHVADIRAIFTADDVPDYLISSDDVVRTVYSRTTVRDDGSIQDCTAELPSGDAKLDAYTCAIIVKRAKLAPAKWSDGTAVYSVLRFPVTYMVTSGSLSPDDMSKSEVPDIELSVDRLPKHAHRFVDVTLEVAVDQTGHVVSCSELPPHKMNPQRHFAELVPIACAQAQKSLSLRPPVDRSGKPVRSVQTASVRLIRSH